MGASDERRKVAEDLRGLCDYHIRYAEQFYEELREIVALDLDGSFEGVANSLAGLIDPTCEWRNDGGNQTPWRCAACGCERSAVPNFCPNCGARVVRVDD